MWLVIKEDYKNQRPIKAYNQLDDAIAYIETYCKESKFEWETTWCSSFKKEKLIKRRYKINRDRIKCVEEIKLRYMTLK